MSIYLRRKLSESPIFEDMRKAGKIARSPIRESFAEIDNLRLTLYILFGSTAGLGCVWHSGQFYALYFLQGVLKVGLLTANICIAVALATPLFAPFGALSDKIGRRKAMVAG